MKEHIFTERNKRAGANTMADCKHPSKLPARFEVSLTALWEVINILSFSKVKTEK